MEIKNYIKNELKKKGFEDIVIVKTGSESKQLKFSKNKIIKTETGSSDDISLFITKNKRVLYTNLKEFSKQSIDIFIKKALKFIKNLPENNNYYGIAEGPFKYKQFRSSYEKKVLDLDDIDLLQKSINSSLNEGAKRTDGVYEVSRAKIELLTSNKVDVEEFSSSLYLSMRSFVNKESSGHSNIISRTLKNFDVDYVGKNSGRIAKLSINPKDGKKGKYDIIFDPLPFSCLAAEIGNSSSIFSVESGLSFLADKLKKQVASKKFSLIDDPLYKDGIQATKFDLEGAPTRKKYIIEDGILNTYLHNTSTAKKYKTQTTGNAGLIAPQPWNLIVKPGKINHEHMFSHIKKGVYITNLWYTRFTNHFTGDFSTMPRDGAFLIENGEIKYPIKNIRISDNMLNIMKNIKEVSNNSIQTKSWESQEPAITPSVLVSNINITKPAS